MQSTYVWMLNLTLLASSFLLKVYIRQLQCLTCGPKVTELRSPYIIKRYSFYPERFDSWAGWFLAWRQRTKLAKLNSFLIIWIISQNQQFWVQRCRQVRLKTCNGNSCRCCRTHSKFSTSLLPLRVVLSSRVSHLQRHTKSRVLINMPHPNPCIYSLNLDIPPWYGL